MLSKLEKEILIHLNQRPMNLGDLVDALGKPASTIRDQLDRLLRDDYVELRRNKNKQRGRPTVFFKVKRCNVKSLELNKE